MSEAAVLNRPSVERQLRDRIEELEEELRQLREAALPTMIFPSEWKLQPSQKGLLESMLKAPGGFVSHEQAFNAVRKWADGSCGLELVRARVHYLRRHVRPFGIEIKTRWGLGYELTPASKVIIKTAIEQRALS